MGVPVPKGILVPGAESLPPIAFATSDQLITRCRRVSVSLGWRHPFFLPALPYIKWRIAYVGTACVSKCGHMSVDPRFAERLSDEQLAGVVAHELSHLIYRHAERKGNRHHERWNRAADRALNAILREAGIQLPDGCLYPQGDQDDWCAEDLYDVEPEQEGDGKGGRAPAGGGCGVDPAEGDGDQDGDDDGQGNGDGQCSGQGSAQGPDGKDWDQHWRDVAAQCNNQGRGTGSGDALRRLADPPPTKIRWETILRRSFVQAALSHGREDTTFRRRSRRSGATGPIFPAYTAYKAQAAVCIDTSGSMGDDAVAAAASHAVKIARVCGVRLFLVAHTSRAYFAQWIPATSTFSGVTGILRETGGTDFTEAYQKVAQCGGRFDALVHLTDGECTWPTAPYGPKPANAAKLIVALIGRSYRDAVPDIAQVIDVETPSSPAT